MADTIKLIIILVMVSIVFHVGYVATGHTGWLGDDVLSNWVQRDSSGEFINARNESVVSAGDTLLNQNTEGTISGTSFFNLWDITQLVWSYIALIFNIVFALPFYLFVLPGMPDAIRIGFILPVIIISLVVFVFGIFGRR